MNKASKDVFMYTLAGLVMVLLFGSLYVIFFIPIPMENKELAYMGFGLAMGWGTLVLNYFFGSTKGSSEKTEMIYKSTANENQSGGN